MLLRFTIEIIAEGAMAIHELVKKCLKKQKFYSVLLPAITLKMVMQMMMELKNEDYANGLSPNDILILNRSITRKLMQLYEEEYSTALTESQMIKFLEPENTGEDLDEALRKISNSVRFSSKLKEIYCQELERVHALLSGKTIALEEFDGPVFRQKISRILLNLDVSGLGCNCQCLKDDVLTALRKLPGDMIAQKKLFEKTVEPLRFIKYCKLSTDTIINLSLGNPNARNTLCPSAVNLLTAVLKGLVNQDEMPAEIKKLIDAHEFLSGKIYSELQKI